jgi:hypothetical protein
LAEGGVSPVGDDGGGESGQNQQNERQEHVD